MRKSISILLLGVAALASAPSAANAQNYFFRSARRAWLGLSYEPTITGRGAERAQTIVITDIVSNSPAERAGLEVGDTLLQVNRLNATDELLSSLGVSLEPGDEVELRVRRAGEERDLTVEAAAPPADEFVFAPGRSIITFDADSMRDRIRIMIDSARIHLDSLDLPNLYIERMPYALRMRSDSLWFNGDSIRVHALRMRQLGDSIGSRWQIYTDSMFGDSAWGRFRIDLDSLHTGWFNMHPDSFHTYRRFEALPYAGIATFGARSIAGAELTSLNSELGDYFGADEGVLVLRVPDGTPAAEAGIQAGDVIVGADGRDITSIDELRRAILRAPARIVPLEIIRQRQRIEIQFRR